MICCTLFPCQGGVSPDFKFYHCCHTSILIAVIDVQYVASIKSVMSNMKKHGQSTASPLLV